MVRKIRSDWPVTERLKDWTRNPNWQKGYREVNEGAFDILQPVGFSTMWAFLSASNDGPLTGAVDLGVGQLVYEKIANMVQNIRDIDTSTMVALRSMANEMDVNNVIFYDIDYPLELREMLDILSVKRSLLLTSGQMITDYDLGRIHNTLQTDHLTGKLSGYDLSADIWTPEQVDNINTLQNVSGYTIIPDDDYLLFAERELSCLIVRNILLDDGVILRTLNTTDIPPDTAQIEDLKDQLSIPESFSAFENANLVLDGVNLLESYSDTEQTLILFELERRGEQTLIFGTQATRFLVDRTNIVRQYVKFVEDVNIYTSSLITDDCGFLAEGSVSSFFDIDSFGNPISGHLITNTVHMLRNIILNTSYQRDYLKQIAQKTALIGAEQIITSLLSEYITRNFRSPEFWRLFKFDNTDNAILSAILDVSGLQGQIEVLEYFDATEYMNLSSYIDMDTNNNVNNRFWEGFESERNITNSDITSACVSAFYNNIGITSGLSETTGIMRFLNDVYNMGAVSATTDEYASFETLPVDISPTGEFGTYGGWQFLSAESATVSTYTLSADVAPIFGYVSNAYTADWMTSQVLCAVPLSDFATQWAQTPVVSTWQTDYYLSGGDISGWGANPIVQQWIDNTYGVSAWQSNIHTNIWRTSVLVNSWTNEFFNSEWQTSVDANSGDVQFAIDNVWRNVDTLNNDVFGWKAIPEVSSYLNTTPTPTQTQWEFAGSGFIQTWVNAPFTSAVVANTFRPDDNWLTSPFVETWIEDPFDLVLINSGIVSAVQGDLLTLNTALCSIGAIDGPDGGLFRNSDITGNSLSGMFLKYMGSPSGDFPPANVKNIVHPTVAITPYVWNLKPKLGIDECVESIFLGTFRDSESETFLLSTRINEYGSTVSSWIDDINEYTGYKTYFEDSRNLDFREELNAYIDRDGPWHPNALSAYLENSSTVIQQLTGGNSPYFNQVILHPDDVTKIANQLTIYEDDIKALSGATIYQHAVDKFGNHYSLFKDDDEHDTQGRIWMRFLNHPFSFPLVSEDLDFEKSQLDVNINTISFLPTTVNYCNDFNFVNDNYFTVLGANPNASTPVDEQFSGISGFVSLVAVGFETFFNEDNRTKLLAFKDENIVFEGWALNEDQKYIGWYDGGIDSVVVAYLNNSLKTGFDDYTVPVADGYIANLKFNVYEPGRSLVEVHNESFATCYDEYRLPVSGGFHNQWRLSRNNTILTIAFESECPSGERYIENGEGLSGVYDPDTNTDCSFFDNGITYVDFTVTNSTPYGHDPRLPEHFCKYSELTFEGLNAGDTTVVDGPSIQFFGDIGTEAYFTSGDVGTFIVSKTSSTTIEICLSSDFNPYTWGSLMIPWSDTDPLIWGDAPSGVIQCNTFTNGDEFTYNWVTDGEPVTVTLRYETDGCSHFITKPLPPQTPFDPFEDGCEIATEESLDCSVLSEDGCVIHAEDCGVPSSSSSSQSSSHSSQSSSLICNIIGEDGNNRVFEDGNNHIVEYCIGFSSRSSLSSLSSSSSSRSSSVSSLSSVSSNSSSISSISSSSSSISSSSSASSISSSSSSISSISSSSSSN
jgi:hypothetical protein